MKKTVKKTVKRAVKKAAKKASGPAVKASGAAKKGSTATLVSAFGAGLLFAVGLVVGGMTQPAKVIGFLDFFGDWDPSLVFVMGGAVVVHFITYRLILKRSSPLLAAKFQIPSRSDLSRPLVIGSALFGIGWALGGYCPGPGIVAVGSGSLEALTFALGLIGGFVAFRFLPFRASRAT